MKDDHVHQVSVRNPQINPKGLGLYRVPCLRAITILFAGLVFHDDVAPIIDDVAPIINPIGDIIKDTIRAADTVLIQDLTYTAGAKPKSVGTKDHMAGASLPPPGKK